jgi:hypothetical protein
MKGGSGTEGPRRGTPEGTGLGVAAGAEADGAGASAISGTRIALAPALSL